MGSTALKMAREAGLEQQPPLTINTQALSLRKSATEGYLLKVSPRPNDFLGVICLRNRKGNQS